MSLEDIKFGDDYQNAFDPDFYQKFFYHDFEETENDSGYLKFNLDTLHEFVQLIPAESLRTILDFGAGPSIYITTIMSAKASNIYLAEFSERNRNVLRSWHEGNSDHDWSAVQKYIAKLEESDAEGLNARARSKVRGVFSCDVRKDQIVPELAGKRFDTIVSALCLEAAVLSLEDFRKAFEKLNAALKPGGYLLLVSMLEETFYSVGNQKFAHFGCTRQELISTVEATGFQIRKLRTSPRKDGDADHDCDYSSCYGLLAQKTS